jgi:methylated-DNA-[protein]-cysteine S-methyltransferase
MTKTNTETKVKTNTKTMTGHVSTPIGRLQLTWVDREGSDPVLCGARFERQLPPVDPFLARHGLVPTGGERPVPGSLAGAFERYFAGDVTVLSEIPTLESGTPFQIAVWRALRKIPVAETRSYGDIARSVGRPRAFRAVGAANRTNPIAIVVPCHRVIGSDGSLTGYGGGLDRKEWLLAHERAHARDGRRSPA